ncbi:hypothetical protein BsWGS_06224 [Bradybaena similaris]
MWTIHCVVNRKFLFTIATIQSRPFNFIPTYYLFTSKFGGAAAMGHSVPDSTENKSDKIQVQIDTMNKKMQLQGMQLERMQSCMESITSEMRSQNKEIQILLQGMQAQINTTTTQMQVQLQALTAQMQALQAIQMEVDKINVQIQTLSTQRK